ncbi:MAG: hypothetical protein IT204_01070 [Fimbriimonadaceae bacterium]|nr:hypothetical protein [Fimbriimonadaceae bacterium]
MSRRHHLLLVLILLGGGGCGLWAAHQAHRAALRREVLAAHQAGRAAAVQWVVLSPADRGAVVGALLQLPAVRWDLTLAEAAVVDLLLQRLLTASGGSQRAQAARALAEVVQSSVDAPAVTAALEAVVGALQRAAEADPEPAVRGAAAAALVRLGPAARRIREHG